MTVEELFGRDDAAVPVTAIPVAPLGGTGARVTLAPVGDGYVALPLRGGTASRSGFLPAGGLTAEAGTGPAPGRMSGRSGRHGPPWSRRAAIRRCRCWGLRSGCLIRRSRSAGGRARAGKHSGWPPTDWCTSPGRTCAGRAASTTSARPLTCCPGAAPVRGAHRGTAAAAPARTAQTGAAQRFAPAGPQEIGPDGNDQDANQPADQSIGHPRLNARAGIPASQAPSTQGVTGGPVGSHRDVLVQRQDRERDHATGRGHERRGQSGGSDLGWLAARPRSGPVPGTRRRRTRRSRPRTPPPQPGPPARGSE